MGLKANSNVKREDGNRLALRGNYHSQRRSPLSSFFSQLP